ncbi:DUF4386 family protein [Ilumatobacter nonamiensis]|uniref:DUF4386 family protein n=1 Tax=Ilumatobacter nonamiensis TaxID=467093 RepID=UPI00058F7359|nr:DUF4386 family protein [Ilumatobacter nonamiensis]
MTQHTVHPTPARVGEDRPPSDVRRVWRILFALVAPVPWLALAISNGITPDDLGGTTEETFRAIASDPSAARAVQWLGLVFSLLLVPSAVAMIVAHRRVMPRLTLLVGGFVAYACCSALVNPNLNLIALITADHGFDSGTTTDLATRLEEYPTTIVAILPFFLTITLGRIALGALLWKARTAPRPLATAMLLASPVEFVLAGGPFGSNLGPTLSYVLTSIGFAAASVALWRMTDDEFDLPPTGVGTMHPS